MPKRKRNPLKPKSLPSIPALKKKADTLFSKAIRYRDGKLKDGEWYTECITCGKWALMKTMHAGHFQPRGRMATRWNEENVNGQCAGCNTYRGGEQYKYGLAIDLKYGDGTAVKLFNLSKEDFKLTRPYLEQVIADAKEEIAFYEKQST